jgi:hypothetical protein
MPGKSNKIAQVLLDFRPDKSVCNACVGGLSMDAALAENILKIYLAELRTCLEDASRIAKAADACGTAGNADKGVQVALDVEPLLHDATRLLDAATMVKQLAKE